jgi:hypothetical protein
MLGIVCGDADACQSGHASAVNVSSLNGFFDAVLQTQPSPVADLSYPVRRELSFWYN